MTEHDLLAERFEADRARLRAVAYRMLGSAHEADDAVQESWLRLSRAGADGVSNLSGWLTTVTARVCLDMLRSRAARREEPLAEPPAGDTPGEALAGGPEEQALLADSVGLALLVVLETLTPAERVAFVLHDMFELPFEEIAPIVDRSPAAARQLASRARRRVSGAGPSAAASEDRRHEVVAAFLAASREGDFAALLRVLDPDVVSRADEAMIDMGGGGSVASGADAVARAFAGRARAARPALLDGAPGLVWMLRGEVKVAFQFTFTGDLISAIDLIAGPGRLSGMTLTTTARDLPAALRGHPAGS